MMSSATSNSEDLASTLYRMFFSSATNPALKAQAKRFHHGTQHMGDGFLAFPYWWYLAAVAFAPFIGILFQVYRMKLACGRRTALLKNSLSQWSLVSPNIALKGRSTQQGIGQYKPVTTTSVKNIEASPAPEVIKFYIKREPGSQETLRECKKRFLYSLESPARQSRRERRERRKKLGTDDTAAKKQSLSVEPSKDIDVGDTRVPTELSYATAQTLDEIPEEYSEEPQKSGGDLTLASENPLSDRHPVKRKNGSPKSPKTKRRKKKNQTRSVFSKLGVVSAVAERDYPIGEADHKEIDVRDDTHDQSPIQFGVHSPTQSGAFGEILSRKRKGAKQPKRRKVSSPKFSGTPAEDATQELQSLILQLGHDSILQKSVSPRHSRTFVDIGKIATKPFSKAIGSAGYFSLPPKGDRVHGDSSNSVDALDARHLGETRPKHDRRKKASSPTGPRPQRDPKKNVGDFRTEGVSLTLLNKIVSMHKTKTLPNLEPRPEYGDQSLKYNLPQANMGPIKPHQYFQRAVCKEHSDTPLSSQLKPTRHRYEAIKEQGATSKKVTRTNFTIKRDASVQTECSKKTLSSRVREGYSKARLRHINSKRFGSDPSASVAETSGNLPRSFAEGEQRCKALPSSRDETTCGQVGRSLVKSAAVVEDETELSQSSQYSCLGCIVHRSESVTGPAPPGGGPRDQTNDEDMKPQPIEGFILHSKTPIANTLLLCRRSGLTTTYENWSSKAAVIGPGTVRACSKSFCADKFPSLSSYLDHLEKKIPKVSGKVDKDSPTKSRQKESEIGPAVKSSTAETYTKGRTISPLLSKLGHDTGSKNFSHCKINDVMQPIGRSKSPVHPKNLHAMNKKSDRELGESKQPVNEQRVVEDHKTRHLLWRRKVDSNPAIEKWNENIKASTVAKKLDEIPQRKTDVGRQTTQPQEQVEKAENVGRNASGQTVCRSTNRSVPGGSLISPVRASRVYNFQNRKGKPSDISKAVKIEWRDICPWRNAPGESIPKEEELGKAKISYSPEGKLGDSKPERHKQKLKRDDAISRAYETNDDTVVGKPKVTNLRCHVSLTKASRSPGNAETALELIDTGSPEKATPLVNSVPSCKAIAVTSPGKIKWKCVAEKYCSPEKTREIIVKDEQRPQQTLSASPQKTRPHSTHTTDKSAGETSASLDLQSLLEVAKKVLRGSKKDNTQAKKRSKPIQDPEAKQCISLPEPEKKPCTPDPQAEVKPSVSTSKQSHKSDCSDTKNSPDIRSIKDVESVNVKTLEEHSYTQLYKMNETRGIRPWRTTKAFTNRLRLILQRNKDECIRRKTGEDSVSRKERNLRHDYVVHKASRNRSLRKIMNAVEHQQTGPCLKASEGSERTRFDSEHAASATKQSLVKKVSTSPQQKVVRISGPPLLRTEALAKRRRESACALQAVQEPKVAVQRRKQNLKSKGTLLKLTDKKLHGECKDESEHGTLMPVAMPQFGLGGGGIIQNQHQDSISVEVATSPKKCEIHLGTDPAPTAELHLGNSSVDPSFDLGIDASQRADKMQNELFLLVDKKQPRNSLLDVTADGQLDVVSVHSHVAVQEERQPLALSDIFQDTCTYANEDAERLSITYAPSTAYNALQISSSRSRELLGNQKMADERNQMVEKPPEAHITSTLLIKSKPDIDASATLQSLLQCACSKFQASPNILSQSAPGLHEESPSVTNKYVLGGHHEDYELTISRSWVPPQDMPMNSTSEKDGDQRLMVPTPVKAVSDVVLKDMKVEDTNVSSSRKSDECSGADVSKSNKLIKGKTNSLDITSKKSLLIETGHISLRKIKLERQNSLRSPVAANSNPISAEDKPLKSLKTKSCAQLKECTKKPRRAESQGNNSTHETAGASTSQAHSFSGDPIKLRSGHKIDDKDITQFAKRTQRGPKKVKLTQSDFILPRTVQKDTSQDWQETAPKIAVSAEWNRNMGVVEGDPFISVASDLDLGDIGCLRASAASNDQPEEEAERLDAQKQSSSAVEDGPEQPGPLSTVNSTSLLATSLLNVTDNSENEVVVFSESNYNVEPLPSKKSTDASRTTMAERGLSPTSGYVTDSSFAMSHEARLIARTLDTFSNLLKAFTQKDSRPVTCGGASLPEIAKAVCQMLESESSSQVSVRQVLSRITEESHHSDGRAGVPGDEGNSCFKDNLDNNVMFHNMESGTEAFSSLQEMNAPHLHVENSTISVKCPDSQTIIKEGKGDIVNFASADNEMGGDPNGITDVPRCDLAANDNMKQRVRLLHAELRAVKHGLDEIPVAVVYTSKSSEVQEPSFTNEDDMSVESCTQDTINNFKTTNDFHRHNQAAAKPGFHGIDSGEFSKRSTSASMSKREIISEDTAIVNTMTADDLLENPLSEQNESRDVLKNVDIINASSNRCAHRETTTGTKGRNGGGKFNQTEDLESLLDSALSKSSVSKAIPTAHLVFPKPTVRKRKERQAGGRVVGKSNSLTPSGDPPAQGNKESRPIASDYLVKKGAVRSRRPRPRRCLSVDGSKLEHYLRRTGTFSNSHKGLKTSRSGKSSETLSVSGGAGGVKKNKEEPNPQHLLKDVHFGLLRRRNLKQESTLTLAKGSAETCLTEVQILSSHLPSKDSDIRNSVKLEKGDQDRTPFVAGRFISGRGTDQNVIQHGAKSASTNRSNRENEYLPHKGTGDSSESGSQGKTLCCSSGQNHSYDSQCNQAQGESSAETLKSSEECLGSRKTLEATQFNKKNTLDSLTGQDRKLGGRNVTGKETITTVVEEAVNSGSPCPITTVVEETVHTGSPCASSSSSIVLSWVGSHEGSEPEAELFSIIQSDSNADSLRQRSSDKGADDDIIKLVSSRFASQFKRNCNCGAQMLDANPSEMSNCGLDRCLSSENTCGAQCESGSAQTSWLTSVNQSQKRNSNQNKGKSEAGRSRSKFELFAQLSSLGWKNEDDDLEEDADEEKLVDNTGMISKGVLEQQSYLHHIVQNLEWADKEPSERSGDTAKDISFTSTSHARSRVGTKADYVDSALANLHLNTESAQSTWHSSRPRTSKTTKSRTMAESGSKGQGRKVREQRLPLEIVSKFSFNQPVVRNDLKILPGGNCRRSYQKAQNQLARSTHALGFAIPKDYKAAQPRKTLTLEEHLRLRSHAATSFGSLEGQSTRRPHVSLNEHLKATSTRSWQQGTAIETRRMTRDDPHTCKSVSSHSSLNWYRPQSLSSSNSVSNSQAAAPSLSQRLHQGVDDTEARCISSESSGRAAPNGRGQYWTAPHYISEPGTGNMSGCNGLSVATAFSMTGGSDREENRRQGPPAVITNTVGRAVVPNIDGERFSSVRETVPRQATVSAAPGGTGQTDSKVVSRIVEMFEKKKFDKP